MKKAIFYLLIFFPFTFTLIAQTSFWTDINESEISGNNNRVIIPEHYRTFKIDFQSANQFLNTAPSEINNSVPLNSLEVLLPMPDGTDQKFEIWESPVMAPELQQRFPDIRTYTGRGVDDRTATLKIDITPHGFHAMILSSKGRVFIDPYFKDLTEYYISYYTGDFVKNGASTDCELMIEDGKLEELQFIKDNAILTAIGPQLRTYRLCVAATGEYTAYHGGTVALGLAAVVTSVNRVNGVYEKEVGIRMVLVANNNLVIYTNSSTDPYTNNNGSTMLTQNINNLNSVIGSANYDIGHVFSTGGGGVAYLGCVCTSSKAGGVTGSSAPIGDPFDIDYVAHEMGHQFGGNHSFNSVTGSCGGGNRNSTTAYEPGSGSTIMAYAGICGADDLQPHSDAYFHVVSFDEIVLYTNSGNGNSCAVTTSTGNNAPVVTVPAGSFYIPKSTPFSLTGSATDPNGDALTYCWEEYDLGPSGAPGTPSGNAPIFRSFNPTTSTTRIFPKLSDLLNNTSTIGEILPTYTRNLTFRLTVRDNKAGGGGVDWKSIAFNVDGNSGPFLVTSPNTNVSWQGNSLQTVTWNVANTSVSPVNCSNVKILLSTDGGNNFNTVLIASTSNDGSEQVTIPNLPTTQARIKVEAVGNIFFDISNINFTITNNPGVINPVDFSSNSVGSSQIQLSFTPNGNNNNVVVVWNNTGNFTVPAGTPPLPGSPFAGGTLFYNGIVSPQIHTGLISGQNYFYKAFSYDGIAYSSGVSANATTFLIENPSALATVPLSSGEIILFFNPDLMNDNVVITWNNSGVFSTPGGVPGSVGQPFAGGTLLYNGIVSPQIHSGLIAGTHYFYKAFSYDGTNFSSGIISDTSTLSNVNTFQFSFNMSNGWNMVSIPGLLPPGGVQDPLSWWSGKDPASSVFKYSGGYSVANELVPTQGYFLKHSGSRLYNTGDEYPAGGIMKATHNPISVNPGFNLIGVYECSVPANAITSVPPGIITGNYFGYTSSTGYFIADTLDPGFAYWIKTSSSGTITIPECGIDAVLKSAAREQDFSGKIILTDFKDRHCILYAVNPGTDLNKYDLPPVPPADMFDARFGSGRYAEDFSNEQQIIDLQGFEYPVRINSENLNLDIKDPSGYYINDKLYPGREIIVEESSINKLLVSQEFIPTKFSLEQNYPNPFNPSTSIKFSVPEKSFVTIKVYNSLGEEIKTLINDEYEPGNYTTGFYAGEMVSGVYIYKMTISVAAWDNPEIKFSQSKKMLLLK